MTNRFKNNESRNKNVNKHHYHIQKDLKCKRHNYYVKKRNNYLPYYNIYTYDGQNDDESDDQALQITEELEIHE